MNSVVENFDEMAGEFTKRTENGKNIWTCVACGQEIINQSKPRTHVCTNHDEASGQNSANLRSGSTSVPNSPFNPKGTHYSK